MAAAAATVMSAVLVRGERSLAVPPGETRAAASLITPTVLATAAAEISSGLCQGSARPVLLSRLQALSMGADGHMRNHHVTY
jgi:hypothetical protein